MALTWMSRSRKMVVIWLGVVCATILAMVVVGGITRLTHSGLSMVDWRPIMGIVPPLSQSEWQETFELYKQFPEYQKVNRHLDLEGFKRIFYWEYGHRVLGRLIGIVFFLPFVALWWLGHIERQMIPKLMVAFVLGAAQGLLGWYMVKSGLIDMPRVSHYRLAAHLLLAFAILAYLFWLILDLMDVRKFRVNRNFVVGTWLTISIIGIQILYGAFTAGKRAGFGFNTFPKMHEKWIAEAVFHMDPWWINLLESGATIQFVHRWLGMLVLVMTGSLWLWSRQRGLPGQIRASTGVLAIITLLQVALGVLTLVYVVPIELASIHQAGACILVLSVIHLVYVARPAN